MDIPESKTIKISYILSNINKALAFEWIAQELDRSKFELSFILLNPGDSVLENYLKIHVVSVTRIEYTGKKQLPKTIYAIYKKLQSGGIQIVHCHMFDACVAGLTAARLAGIKKRIYTRHHATFHQVYFPRAVWYDKFISSMATDVVAISHNVKQTLLEEGVADNKIHLVHHGFRLHEFDIVNEILLESVKKKYNPDSRHPVIGVISRYFELKGIQYIIPAFKKLLATYPNALLILANATGNYTQPIKELLHQLPAETYIEISFEQELFSLYKLFDIFVHVPVDASIEAFGQTYVEALAAGIPSVFTLSGVAREFIQDKQNALVANFRDSESIYQSMVSLLQNTGLREKLSRQGQEDVKKFFELDGMISRLEKLYLNPKT